jgi:3-mercaptopyruvate sulfurtransferase SseA
MTVAVDELRGWMAAGEDVVVLDARWHYTDPTEPRRMWLAERIPGAAHLDMATAIAGPVREDRIGGRNPMPTPTAFLDGLNRAGARRGARLVAYDGRMEGSRHACGGSHASSASTSMSSRAASRRGAHQVLLWRAASPARRPRSVT